MCNVRVWELAGPIKWNRPSVTIWSVFQNPVTYIATTNSILIMGFSFKLEIYFEGLLKPINGNKNLVVED